MKAQTSRWRMALLCLGWLLVVAAPVIGVLPGPGGIFVFAAGLVLLLRNSCWVRRRYVILARRWPTIGALADKALRRHGAIRRRRARACAVSND